MPEPVDPPDLTINELLLNSSIIHAVELQRVANSLVRDATRQLERGAFRDVIDTLGRLQRLRGRGRLAQPWRTRLYRDTIARVRDQISAGLSAVDDEFLRPSMHRLARLEALTAVGSVGKAINARVPDLEVRFDGITGTTLRRIVNTQPIASLGKPVGQAFRSLGPRMVARIDTQLQAGLISGETIGQLTRRIRGRREFGFRDGVMQATRHEAQTVIRTGVTNSMAQVREAAYAANSDIIKRVMWVSTLDSRTSLICASLDGQTFKIGEGLRPPAHPNCRSTTVPIVDEAGLGGSRASIDGQVPATTTFEPWLRTQTPGVQERVLGARGAELWRQRKLTIGEMVTRAGRPLRVAELERRAG